MGRGGLSNSFPAGLVSDGDNTGSITHSGGDLEIRKIARKGENSLSCGRLCHWEHARARTEIK